MRVREGQASESLIDWISPERSVEVADQAVAREDRQAVTSSSPFLSRFVRSARRRDRRDTSMTEVIRETTDDQ